MWSIFLGSRFKRSNLLLSILSNNVTSYHRISDIGFDPNIESTSISSGSFFDRLLLLSPRTWWGVIDYEDKKPFSHFGKSNLVRSVAGFIIPLLILLLIDLIQKTTIQYRRRTMLITESLLPRARFIYGRLLVASLISPWSITCAYEIIRHSITIVRSIRGTIKNQSKALPRASDLLRRRIRHRRAHRSRRYDVYFPPILEQKFSSRSKKSKSFQSGKNAIQALMIIPGALVPHEAYSEVAARLSDRGFVVAVMSLEPLRLATRYLGADKNSVKRIMAQVTNLFSVYVQGRIDFQEVEWTLVGHSMGSFAAMRLLKTFFDESTSNECINFDSKNITDKNVTGSRDIPHIGVRIRNSLVLWGVAAFLPFATDISGCSETDVLIIQGTRDELVSLLRSKQSELEALFPANTVTVEINGGTHEGFSSYEPTFSSRSESNKNKKILSLDRQHKSVCDATARFLQS